MAYKRSIYRFGNTIEVEENLKGRFGAKGESRMPKKKATPEQIKKQNQYNKEKRERRKIKANFTDGDLWVTLTYKKGERPEAKEAVQDLRKTIRKMRTAYKRAGTTLVYIAITEIGSRGGVHHHLIVNRISETDLIINNEWKKGHANLTPLYAEGNFKDLGDYIAKQPDEENKLQFKAYSCSKGMKVVEPEVNTLIRWNKEAKPLQGYYIEKESLVEGINPVTGKYYRHYTLIKLQEVRRCLT